MIPEGMRDVLPPEAAELRAIEQIVLARFGAYGYGEVRPPALEYPETMERTDLVIEVKEVQLRNARSPMVVMLSPRVTEVRAWQSVNAWYPMEVTPFPMATKARLVHWPNARSLIKTTLSGIATKVRKVQSKNAPYPMEMTPLGMVNAPASPSG